MLRGIRKASANWLGRIVMGVVMSVLAASFAVWGINDIFRGFGRSTVAKIGGIEIPIEQFRQTYTDAVQMLGRQSGHMITPDEAMARGMPRQVLSEMVAEAGLNERARQMLVTQLLARRPATPPAAIAAEQSGLDSAIRRIEAEMSRPARGAMPRDEPVDDTDGDISDLSSIVPERGPLATPFRLSGVSLLAVAIVAAAISAGGYMFWVQHAHKALPPPLPRKRHPRRPRSQHPSPRRPKTAISRPASTAARPTTICRMSFAASRRSTARYSRSAPSSSISCSIFSI